MTRPKATTRWRLIRQSGEVYRDIGTNADGTLYNPNGYPEENRACRYRRCRGTPPPAPQHSRQEGGRDTP